ncbi:hypothetical protein ACP4OV_023166 [Aristida adscensionis]
MRRRRQPSSTAMARPQKRRRLTAAVLPDDLLFSDVLARLPVRSLARFRCVCRLWRAGIADPAFVRRHLDLSRAAGRPPSLLVVPREFDPDDVYAASGDISFHRLPFLPAAAETAELMLEQAWPEGISCLVGLAHCDGLVAVATATDRVFVCNPATREFAALPLGSHNADADRRDFAAVPVPVVALGFDRWRSRYVVARLFHRTFGDTPDDIGHEVFTLGGGGGAAGGAWERTEDPPHAVACARPACTRRAFYWFTTVAQPRLLRFGLQDRAFDVVSRPGAGGWNAVDDMAELDDGKLCYVHAAGDAAFQVWTADDAPALEWSLRCRIRIVDPVPRFNYSVTPVTAHGDELLVIDGYKLWMCSMQKKAMGDVVDMKFELCYERPDGSKRCYDSCHSEHYLVPYVESLVSPSLN